MGPVGRNALKPASRNSLVSTLTPFQLNDETAEDLLNALHGKRAEGVDASEEKGELEQMKEDTIGRSA